MHRSAVRRIVGYGDEPACSPITSVTWIHQVLANFKTWGSAVIGVNNGLRRPHLQTYLDEFVFRFNRRSNRHAGLARLLAIGLNLKPAAYNMLITPDGQA